MGRNVRRLRVERRLSQEELAHLAKMNRNYVGMIERKEGAATVDIIERLAAALDVSPVDLIGPDTNRR